MSEYTGDLDPNDPRRGTAYEFFYSHQDVAYDLGIQADTTDDELAAIADIETTMAAQQTPPQIVTGIYEYLVETRDLIQDGRL